MKSESEHQTSTEFMMKQYDLLYTLATTESNQAEQRVNHFLSIFSTALGVLLVLSQISNLSTDMFYSMTQVVLVILLLYGITIQNRLIARGVQHYLYTDLLIEVQKYFSSHEPQIAKYMEAQENIFRSRTSKHGFITNFIGRARGTLQEFMILSNALLCTGIVLVAMLKIGAGTSNIIIVTIVTFIISSALLVAYYYIMLRIVQPFRLTLLD